MFLQFSSPIIFFVGLLFRGSPISEGLFSARQPLLYRKLEMKLWEALFFAVSVSGGVNHGQQTWGVLSPFA